MSAHCSRLLFFASANNDFKMIFFSLPSLFFYVIFCLLYFNSGFAFSLFMKTVPWDWRRTFPRVIYSLFFFYLHFALTCSSSKLTFALQCMYVNNAENQFFVDANVKIHEEIHRPTKRRWQHNHLNSFCGATPWHRFRNEMQSPRKHKANENEVRSSMNVRRENRDNETTIMVTIQRAESRRRTSLENQIVY